MSTYHSKVFDASVERILAEVQAFGNAELIEACVEVALDEAAKAVMALPDTAMFYAGHGKPLESQPGVIQAAEARDAILGPRAVVGGDGDE